MRGDKHARSAVGDASSRACVHAYSGAAIPACEQSVYPNGIRGAVTNRHKQRIGELQKRQRDEITRRDAGATVRAGYRASIEPDSDTYVRAYVRKRLAWKRQS